MYYSFDITKASDIFNHLLIVTEGHKIPPAEELKKSEFCKWHGFKTHSIVNCVVFLNIIQDNINKGLLKFSKNNKEEMGGDVDPFPPTVLLNMIEIKIEVTSERSMSNKEEKGKS